VHLFRGGSCPYDAPLRWYAAFKGARGECSSHSSFRVTCRISRRCCWFTPAYFGFRVGRLRLRRRTVRALYRARSGMCGAGVS